MNNEELMRAFDTMVGLLIAYDNQSRNQALNRRSMEAVEEIRETIKGRKE